MPASAANCATMPAEPQPGAIDLTDDTVLASVQQSDGRVLRAVRHAFVDCGFGPEEAALRSTVVFAAAGMKRPTYVITSSCVSTTQSTSPLRIWDPAAPPT